MNIEFDAVFLGSALATALTTFLLVRLFIRRSKKRAQREILDVINSSAQLGGISSSSETQENSLSAPGLVLKTGYGSWLRRTASRAGIWHEFELEKFVLRKFQIGIAVFILIALGVQSLGLSISLLLLMPALAFFFPDLILFDKAKARIAEIARSLPDTIDLLNMCVSAGIGFHAGMQRVATTEDNPLSQEFSRVLAEMKLGQGRGQALATMAERLGIEPLNQFVNSILQVDRLGVPMAKVLDEQSKRLRGIRREKAREQAQKLPVKILAPTMIFMLPSLLIIVLGPAVVSIIRSFS